MLSVTAQYALRALLQLATAAPGEFLLGRELARRAEVPRNYLSKILLVLNSAGLIEASRGTGGGYRLRRRPEEIPLAEVVALFDRSLTPPACFLGLRPVCSDENPCIAHASWRETKQCLLRFLEETSLAQLADNRGMLQEPAGRPKRGSRRISNSEGKTK
jgi:Rrf2 family iron-sulfur cluster assembly transcriptional regulator